MSKFVLSFWHIHTETEVNTLKPVKSAIDERGKRVVAKQAQFFTLFLILHSHIH